MSKSNHNHNYKHYLANQINDYQDSKEISDKFKQRQKAVYSSRSYSIQYSNSSQPASIVKQRGKGSRRNSLSKISDHKDILKSIRIIKERTICKNIDQIKLQIDNVFAQNSRENRMKLVEILREQHPFFQKINKTIGQAIIMLSKLEKLYKGQLIFNGSDYSKLNQWDKNVRSVQDIGFIMYGKVQLCNDKLFYSHYIQNFGTLFENKFIDRSDKISYYGKVLTDSCIFWLPRSSYYLIRKECFLSLDLKYMFHEFENLLNYNMVHKKLPQFQKA